MKHLTITLLPALVLTLLAACLDAPREIPPEDIYPVVIDVYDHEFAPVPARCVEWLENTGVLDTGEPIPGSDQILSNACPRAGCHTVRAGRSWVYCTHSYLPDVVNACYGHEYLHALHYCVRGEGDYDHSSRALWCDRGTICDGDLDELEDSVEFKIVETLWDMS